VRRLALRWLWWAFVWDIICYCSRNPWRFFLALPLWTAASLFAATLRIGLWRQEVYWNMGECWDAIEAEEVKAPPQWLLARLDPRHYALLGDRSCDSEN
jgi:hypothetical protein